VWSLTIRTDSRESTGCNSPIDQFFLQTDRWLGLASAWMQWGCSGESMRRAWLVMRSHLQSMLLNGSQSDVMCGIGPGVGSRLLGFATKQVVHYVAGFLTTRKDTDGKWCSAVAPL
jgi:hypothetical protein